MRQVEIWTPDNMNELTEEQRRIINTPEFHRAMGYAATWGLTSEDSKVCIGVNATTRNRDTVVITASYQKLLPSGEYRQHFYMEGHHDGQSFSFHS